MSEETKVQAVCECGHTEVQHFTNGCFGPPSLEEIKQGRKYCSCTKEPDEVAEAEVLRLRDEVLQLRKQLERYGAGIWCARCNTHFDTVGMTFDEQNAVMNAHFEECPNNPRMAELRALRQKLAEAQAEKVKAQRKAFMDCVYWATPESVRESTLEQAPHVARERYPDAAQVQAVGEVKRPMPTREQMIVAVENAYEYRDIIDVCKIVNAIMALFTDSAGGGQ